MTYYTLIIIKFIDIMRQKDGRIDALLGRYLSFIDRICYLLGVNSFSKIKEFVNYL